MLQVVAQRRTGGGSVPHPAGVEDPSVIRLEVGRFGEKRVPHILVTLDHAAEPLDDFELSCPSRGGVENGMKLPIDRSEAFRVFDPRKHGMESFRPVKVFLGEIPNRPLEQVAFEQVPKLIDLSDIRLGKLHDLRAAIRKEDHEPFRLEPPQRFAQGNPADSKAPGKFFLRQKSPSLEIASPDRIAKGISDQIGCRRVTSDVSFDRIQPHQERLYTRIINSSRRCSESP